MIVPLVITAGILGGVYYFGQAPVRRPENEPKPLPMPIPVNQIPTELQTRMSLLNSQLPGNLQIPQMQWGDPNAWVNLYTRLTSGGPLPPNAPSPPPTAAPEILAILNALRTLPIPQPTPMPFPPTPIPGGPVQIPPQLAGQLQQVLSGLPPPYNNATAVLTQTFPGTVGDPGLPARFTVDPNAILILAQQVEAALPGRAEPAQLRAIAAQLQNRSASPMQGGAVSIAPAAANVYEQVIRNQGGNVNPEMSQVLSFLQQYGGTPPAPPIAGFPYYDARQDQVGAYAPWQRRRYRRFG